MITKIIFSLLLFSSLFSQSLTENKWQTDFEKSNYLSTSTYEETIKYFKQLSDYSEYAELITIGTSPQGREIKCLIVSKNKSFTPDLAKQNTDAVILVNNGIHSGEIEGKDASMLMLREMLVTKEKQYLLENVVLLFIPVFNLDGHERSSPFGRINQNGPTEMGWRTTAQNLNLNRDFMKADSPEMKSLLKLYSDWLPDLLIDNHTTDGADFQYTITYAISKHGDIPPVTQKLVNEKIIPVIENSMEETRYLISPYVGFVDGDYNNGIRDWVAPPRFSNGYASVQNRIGLLVETHMLKPYKDRVFSTKALMENVIELISKNNKLILETSRKADEFIETHYFTKENYFPIRFELSDSKTEFLYKGFERNTKPSAIAGSEVISYSSEKTEKVVPYFNQMKVTDSVKVPKAYIIPQEWKELVDIMQLHGVIAEKINDSKSFDVEKYKFKNVKFSTWPYEGRFSPSYDYDVITENVTPRVGDFIISTNQRTLGVIVNLLEPKANDSFVNWGFLNIIFERKEYFEEYSMEPIAQKMYSESPELRKEFDELVNSDSVFAANKRERLNFFYERSPYYDQKYNVYPILRVIN